MSSTVTVQDKGRNADGVRAGLRRRAYQYRTEGAGAGRQAAAVGLGVFVGCLPVYGLHLWICLLLGWLLKLNRLKLYLAANISNPLLLPLLLLVQVQLGAWLRRGATHALTLATARTVNPWHLGLDLLVGATVLGAVLGIGAAALTYIATRTDSRDPVFTRLADRASERYVRTSLTGWEFANAKLRSDPVYRSALRGGLLPSGGTFLDIGCGQGLMIGLLAEARQEPDARDAPPLPRFDRLVGIETRSRTAQLARVALGPDAEILEADVTTRSLPACAAAVMFDVLQMMPRDRQDGLLSAVRNAMAPGAVLLVREADPSSGWRFAIVRFGNRMKALVNGAWRQPLCYRNPEDWLTTFQQTGFEADLIESGGPLGNVLFRLVAIAHS